MKKKTPYYLASVIGMGLLIAFPGSVAAQSRSGGVGTEMALKDLRLRLNRVNANDIENLNDDSADVLVRTATSSYNLTLREYESVIVDDFEINMLNVVPNLEKPGDGTARINIVALR